MDNHLAAIFARQMRLALIYLTLPCMQVERGRFALPVIKRRGVGLGSGLINLTEMALDMTRYARKNLQSGFFPRTLLALGVLTLLIAVRSNVLRIGWICPANTLSQVLEGWPSGELAPRIEQIPSDHYSKSMGPDLKPMRHWRQTSEPIGPGGDWQHEIG
ncbi:MAG: hypothetical protein R3D29_11690 [Nitratireductor sp.]